MARPFLTAGWRNLVVLNFEIDPEVLRPLVPRGTAPDPWDGRHFISVVGLRFVGTRVLGIPVPFHRDFDEVNLRCYVRREAPEGVRRGVFFVKEVVARRAVAAVARWLYNENYVARRMRAEVRPPEVPPGRPGRLAYSWAGRSGWNVVAAEFAGAPALPAPGSVEEFITEHYWGYVPQRDGSTLEYRVERPKWRVWEATRAELVCDVEDFYGRPYADALGRPPSSAFVAEGSEVAVYRGRRIA